MSRAIDIILGALDDEIEDTVKRLTAEVVAELVEETPVDTGWLRSNWIPRVGEATPDVVGSRDAVTDATQGAAVANVIASYRIADGPVTIQNNVPYAPHVFLGTVKRAPSGSIEGAIDRARQTVLGGE